LYNGFHNKISTDFDHVSRIPKAIVGERNLIDMPIPPKEV